MSTALRSTEIAKAPFVVLCDSKDRERWLRVRRTAGIGASEVAVILGISPFQSAYHLACVKTGRIQADDLSENERVFWGLELEDAIISGYSKRTGRKTVPFGLTLRSLRHPWLFATPDALVSEKASALDASRVEQLLVELRSGHEVADELWQNVLDFEWRPLQCKNIGFGSAEHWTEGVPDYYEAQCRAEAIVFGSEVCTSAALVAGQQLIWDDVARTELSDKQIINLTRAFWHECQAGRLPPVDGSESTKSAIVAQWPRERPDDAVQLGAEWLDLADELADKKADKKAAEARIAEIENRLKAEIQDASRAVLPDGSAFTYRSQKRAAVTMPATSFRVLRRQKSKGDE